MLYVQYYVVASIDRQLSRCSRFRSCWSRFDSFLSVLLVGFVIALVVVDNIINGIIVAADIVVSVSVSVVVVL